MSFLKPLIAAGLCLWSLTALSQTERHTFALPMDQPTVDGNLNDWPQDLHRHIITHAYGAPNTEPEDFHATFMTGYNQAAGEIYVAVEVIDHHYVGASEPNFDLQDQAILYLDRGRDPRGGAPIYFVQGEKERQIVRHPSGWESVNSSLKDSDVRSAVARTGNRTIYEWAIKVGDQATAGSAFGIDHFLLDSDPGQEGQGYLLWTSEFGKSGSSRRLGRLLLVEKEQQFGTVAGKVVLPSGDKVNAQPQVDLQSVSHPDYWVHANVDSNGRYELMLPVGEYRVQAANWFTSPLFSSGFKQQSRRLKVASPVSVVVKADQLAEAKALEPEVSAYPELPAKLGVLHQKKFKNKEFEAQLSEWQRYFEVPGVSVAVIKDNKVVYQKALGVKNAVSQEPLTEASLFEAASISKSVFATMVLRLAERGVIDLDRPLHEYLPFYNLDGDDRFKKLTARLVLNHRSGLPNWAFGGPGGWEAGEKTELNFAPGDDFGYSGEAFNYLGRVVSHITQKPLTQLFQEEIAEPFGLTNTSFCYNETLADKIAMGHYQQYPFYKQKDPASPASSLITNATDFSKYVLGMMNEKHLAEASLALIYKPGSVLNEENRLYDAAIPQFVSHGFFVQERKHGLLIGHGGNNGDYDCKYAYYPETKSGYIIYTNSNMGDEFIRLLEVYLTGNE